jgi:hypothetical protein
VAQTQKMSSTEHEPSVEPQQISVKYNFQGSLRRSTIGFPPKINALRKKLARSFPDHANLFEDKSSNLRLVYTDDEGDLVTITTNDELLTAYRLAQKLGKVLRFTVPDFEKQPQAIEETVETQNDQNASEPTPEVNPTTVKAVFGAPQAAVQVVGKKSSSDAVQFKKYKHKKAVASEPTSSPVYTTTFYPAKVVDAIVTGLPVHFDKTCAATGASPIIGTAYKMLTNDDQEPIYLCEDGYAANKVDNDKTTFEEVSLSTTGANINLPRKVKVFAKKNGVAVHYNVRCDVTGIQPILGNRYNLQGANYDLCQYAYDQLSESDKDVYTLVGFPQRKHNCGSFKFFSPVHVGFTCDRSGMNPIVGPRWTKRNENYDLCDAEFQKLSPVEKQDYDCIRVSNQMPQPAHRPFKWQKKPKTNKSGYRYNENRGHHSRIWRTKADAARAHFVKDLTVNDRASKNPNESFEKAWVMRAGKCGVPAGSMLVFVGGSPLGAQQLRIPVQGPIIPGESFVLKAQLVAPEKVGHYRSFWRLQTAMGRRFGPRIWADIMVAEPLQQANQGNSMKFLKDTTIPDGSTIEPGKSFRKTWLVSSPTGWGDKCLLRCLDVHGSFTGLKELLPSVPPKSKADIAISLTAPSVPGHYRSFWELVDRNNQSFGDTLFVDFKVSCANTTSAPTVPVLDLKTVKDSAAESNDQDTHENKNAFHGHIEAALNAAIAAIPKSFEDSNPVAEEINETHENNSAAHVNIEDALNAAIAAIPEILGGNTTTAESNDHAKHKNDNECHADIESVLAAAVAAVADGAHKDEGVPQNKFTSIPLRPNIVQAAAQAAQKALPNIQAAAQAAVQKALASLPTPQVIIQKTFTNFGQSIGSENQTNQTAQVNQTNQVPATVKVNNDDTGAADTNTDHGVDTTSDNAEKVATLGAMGFSEAEAKCALEFALNDVQRAVEYLTSEGN